MARMRVFLVLLLALTAGGALAFGTYNYVSNTPSSSHGGRYPEQAGGRRGLRPAARLRADRR